MRRPVPDEVILGLLKSCPAHGYDLLEAFRSRDKLGHVWTLSTSQLYAVLKRLEVEGSILGERKKSKDAPERIVYSITEKGSEKVNLWLFDDAPSSSIHRIRVLFLSRLYIANLLGLETKDIVDNQRSVCEQQIKNFNLEKKIARSSFEKLTLDFIVSQLKSALIWLDQCEKEISKHL